MRIPVYIGFIIILTFFACKGPEQEPVNPNFLTWEQYSGDAAGTKYSALDHINRDNVSKLQPVWTYTAGDMGPGTTIQCNPIVVGKTMFITTQKFKLVALDATNGKGAVGF